MRGSISTEAYCIHLRRQTALLVGNEEKDLQEPSMDAQNLQHVPYCPQNHQAI